MEIPDVSDSLAKLGESIALLPDPYRTILVSQYQALAGDVAGLFRFIIERDQKFQADLSQLAVGVGVASSDVAMDLAYINFDLVATRRERDALQDQLGDQNAGLQE